MPAAAPANEPPLSEAVLDGVGPHAQADAGRGGGEGVLDVVDAWHMQRDVREQTPMAVYVELTGRAYAADIARVDVRFVREAEGEELAAKRGEGLHRVAVVEVGDNLAGGRHLCGELAEAVLHVLQAGEVVEVVGLYVQYDGDGRMESQETVAVLAALEYDGVPAADTVSGVQQGQRAAQHDGRVALCGHEYVGAHAGRGGLAVGARYAQRVGVVAHDCAPGLRAFKDGDAPSVGLDNLAVVIVYCGGTHDELYVRRNVHGAVSNLHIYAQGTQMLRFLALGHV